MKVNPYLNFDGNCMEAFEFYKSVFGGDFSDVNTFGDMPESDEYKVSDEEKDRIMHISLPVGDFILMGSDISPSMGHKLEQGNMIYVSLHPETKDEGQRLFDELSKGGEVEMQYEKMFWGAYYAAFRDKFGIQWMINWDDKQK